MEAFIVAVLLLLMLLVVAALEHAARAGMAKWRAWREQRFRDRLAREYNWRAYARRKWNV